jgi:DNA-directed RNA polymerase specialized sigma24 family protein
MTPAGPTEITVLLRAWGDGDQAAFERLATLVYHDLLRMARRYMKNERAGNSLQTTALVKEASFAWWISRMPAGEIGRNSSRYPRR